jgi:hypothetical protein
MVLFPPVKRTPKAITSDAFERVLFVPNATINHRSLIYRKNSPNEEPFLFLLHPIRADVGTYNAAPDLRQPKSWTLKRIWSEFDFLDVNGFVCVDFLVAE